MALFKKYPGKGTEEEDARESAIMRLLKAGCLPHFGSFAFRSAFFAHCLDTKVLQALLRAQLAAPLWQRRVAGVACARAQPAQVSLQNLGVLEAEGLGAAHGCLSALLFEAHALEAPDYALSSEELQLLEQSNYSLAYLPPKVRSKLASLLLPQSTWREPPAEKALSYPRAGDEDGLLLLDLWVLPHEREDAPAWRLPLAYGMVPALAPGDVAAYRRQVCAAVRAVAVSCDALLVGCAGGLPGTGRGVISPEEAAMVWADVLRSTKGVDAPLERCFKQVAFCFGTDDSERLRRARRALAAAFGLAS